MTTGAFAELPLVDLHLHQERSARLNQVMAATGEQRPVDWRAWSSSVGRLPPGMPRLEALWASCPTPVSQDVGERSVSRFELLLLQSAEAGAVLAEVRVGNETLLRDELLRAFVAAEARVRARHPTFHASLVGVLKLWHLSSNVEAALSACIDSGVGGVDFLYVPYASEAQWNTAHRLAERATAAGLGVTAHAGEFSTSNIAAVLDLPGITRMGHAVHAVNDPALFELLVTSNVAVECCLTSNVVLGSVRSLEEHPLRRLADAGVPVVLGTDNPLQLCTDIGREYALARSLGLGDADLLEITRTAVSRSFAPQEVKAELLACLPPALARHAQRDDTV